MMEMKINETRFNDVYVIEDSGKKYIYDESKNDLHEATNLEMNFYKPRNRYETRFEEEYDDWRYSWN